MSVFTGIAADFVKAAKKFKSILLTAAADAPKVMGKVAADAPEVEALINLIYPGSSAIESTSLAVLEAIATAVEGAGTAAGANGLTVSLDQAVIADVKAILPTLQKLIKAA